MYQTIGENIIVIAAYYQTRKPRVGKLVPKKFLWRNQTYVIEEITLVNDTKDGGVRKSTFSAIVKGNIYRISFNRETEDWVLEEVWYDG